MKSEKLQLYGNRKGPPERVRFSDLLAY